MKKIFRFLFLLPTMVLLQNIDIDRNKIIENNISRIKYRIHAVKSLYDFDSLIVGESHYNKYGFKTYEKLLFPFQDIVTTMDQTYYHYDNDSILLKKIKIHNPVRLTNKDDSYVDFFGIDYDTTIYEYDYYVNGLLKTEITYSKSNKDTIRKEYFYNDSKQLMRIIQNNSSYKKKFHEDNFYELYFYSKNKLLDSVQHFPLGLTKYSNEVYMYDEHLNLIEKKVYNGFKYVTIVNFGKEDSIEIEQDLSVGSIERNFYDKNNRLLKIEIGYFSPDKIDIIIHYIYDKDGHLIEKYIENKSEKEPILIGHTKYIYNTKGLIIAEKILEDNETQFEYIIEYE